ncbi:MAG: hypothetical protein JWQ89_826 [Devosia sp.]|nr:hypothetical protein [Devosia sp.]
MWQVLVTAQATREPCGVQRQPIDDEIDAGVAEIDLFIMANAKRFPATPDSLATEKANIVQIPLDALKKYPEARADICYATNAFHGMPAWPPEARQLAARAMRHSVRGLLSIPREPVMNPCL